MKLTGGFQLANLLLAPSWPHLSTVKDVTVKHVTVKDVAGEYVTVKLWQ